MTMTAHLLVTADADQAKAALEATGRAATQAAAGAKTLEQAGGKSQGTVRKLGGSANTTAAELQRLTQAESAAAREALVLAKNQRAATGQMGNITAQFNDIGMMLASGQNPFQLAMQQGTQLTQVFNQMGGGREVLRGIAGGLMSMVNPISLITLGSIAAGAAMINWLTASEDEVASMQDTIEAATSAIDAFAKKAKTASMSTGQMFAEFGSADPVLKQVFADLAGLAKLDAYAAIDRTAASVRALVLDLSFWDDRSAQSAAQDFLGLGNMTSKARAAGDQFARNLQLLQASSDPAEKLQLAIDLRTQLLDSTNGYEGLNGEQRQFYEGLAAIIRDLSLMGVKVKEAETAMNGLAQKQQQNHEWMVRMREEANRATTSAQEMLATLTEENAIRQATLQYGAQSAEVVQLQQAAQRQVYAEMVNTLDVADSLKAELMAAFDEGQALGSLNLASGVGAAADEARRLAKDLGLSFSEAVRLVMLARSEAVRLRKEAPSFGAGLTFGGGGVIDKFKNPILNGTPGATNENGFFVYPTSKADRPGRGGGGRAKSIRDERDAVAELIAKEQEQLDLLRETDPVQKEMLRHRKELIGATEAEKQALETLIATRLKEEAAIKSQQEAWDFLGQTGYDALDSLIFQGQSLSEVMGNVAKMIGQAVLQAAILGKGPLAGFLGITGPIFGGGGGSAINFNAYAEGGLIYGPGSGTSDQVPILASSGEFMMNASATARYRHVLEAMNAGGRLPGFATGGMIGGSASLGQTATTAPALSGHLHVSMAPGLIASLKEDWQADAIQITQGGLSEFDRTVLPQRMRQISNDPRRIG